MRKAHAKLILSLCMAALLLSACSGGGGKKDGLLLYFVPIEVNGGSALVGEPSSLTAEDATVEQLMAALLSGPTDTVALRSPIPPEVELLGVSKTETCVTVDLSERYGGLSDVKLTLADYAITLTLCQLPGVESVRITAAGKSVPGRALRELKPSDVLLSGELPAENP